MKPIRNSRVPLMASLGALVLVILLFAGFLISSGGFSGKSSGIVLPTTEGAGTDTSVNHQVLTAQKVAEVTISPENVKKVVSSLSRASAYSFRISNTLHYGGGEGTFYCHVYRKRGVVRTDTVTQSDGIISTMMRKGDIIYNWDAGQTAYYTGSAGSFSDDMFAMLPTYEDILEDGLAIVNAGKIDADYETCIFAEFERDGYRCRYEISAGSGLLKNALFYEGDTLVREVHMTELSIDPPADTYFQLPDGTSLLGE